MTPVATSRAFFGLAAALLFPLLSSRADDRISIDAKINGQVVHLAFDTGAEGLVLFRSAVEQLGLKTVPAPAETKPGNVAIGSTEPVKLELMGRSFDDTRFYVLDVPAFFNDIQGMVGWPVLRNNIVLMKIAEHKFVLGLEEVVPAESANWLKLPLRSDHQVLCLELPAKAGVPSHLLLIDTGDEDSVSLSAEKWREWKAAHPREPVTLTAHYMPGSGLVVREEARAKELSLDGLVLHDVVVKESNATQTSLGGPQYIASLGLAALSRLDLLINGKTGLAYVHPRTDPPLAIPHNRLGAVFVPRDEQSDDLVAHVAAGSPADTAGIRNNDLLLAIDQLDVTKWRTQPGILPFSQYWEQPAGKKIVLTLKRGKDVIKKTATLKNILGP